MAHTPQITQHNGDGTGTKMVLIAESELAELRRRAGESGFFDQAWNAITSCPTTMLHSLLCLIVKRCVTDEVYTSNSRLREIVNLCIDIEAHQRALDAGGISFDEYHVRSVQREADQSILEAAEPERRE